jgi:hypothetical protein
MKKIGITILGLAIAILAHAQDKETRKLSSFDEVSVSEAINLIIEEGTEEKAVVEVSGIDLEDVITEVRGSKLDIHMGRGNYRSISVTVYLTFKTLKSIDVSSAADLESKSVLKGNELSIQVNSAGRAVLEVDVDALDVDVNSAGKLELSGKCNFNNIDINSAGKLYAYELQSKKVNADVNSAAKAEISVISELIAEANSGGSIYYKGNPEKVISNSDSGGRVRKN